MPHLHQTPFSRHALYGIPKGGLTGHGFRAMAGRCCIERLKFPPEIIEHQLAQRSRMPLDRPGNRTRFLDDRRVMMQAWADYLDQLKAGAVIIPDAWLLSMFKFEFKTQYYVFYIPLKHRWKNCSLRLF